MKVVNSQPKNLGGEGEAKYIVEANKLEWQNYSKQNYNKGK